MFDPIASSSPSRACRTAASTAVLLLLATPATVLGQSDVYESQAHDFRVATVAEGLENPWSMAWLPNGDMLITERPGRLRIVRDGRLLPDPVPGVPTVRVGGQGGLQEVAVHPDFSDNRLIYLSFSKDNADGSLGTTAVVRGRLENDRLTGVEEVFEAKAWAQTPGHYGARIVFDGNGYMFISVGDRMAPPAGDLESHPAQDRTNHQGTIVRLHDDGRVPEDNPFVGRDDVLPEIWSFGHRNPQGLAMNPETGDLWDTEHGPQGGDELNVIRRGANYGWPVIGYGANYVVGTEIHASRNKEGMEQPAAFWVPSIGISGLVFYQGDEFPNWKGNAFVGGMSGNYQRLVRVILNGETVIGREPLLVGEYRIRDVREGPDGLLYLAIDNIYGQPSEIIRLEPTDE